MRTVAATLLLMLLPALLLPAGVLWRVCRCELVRIAARACCAPEAPAAEPRETCCDRHVAPAPKRDPGELPRADADDCGCLWLEVPHASQQPSPPEPAPPLALPPEAPMPRWHATLPLRAAQPRSHLAATSRPPPPPHCQRNLPLRS